jgi:Domain of unknown function (DUF4406)
MILDSTLKWYIAGPMSGIPQFNIPAFDKLAALLRADGYDVVSPAELDNERVRVACLASADGANTEATNDGGTWAEFLARDVKLIADQIGGIIFLPGWNKSRGARLEAFVGLLTGKQFAQYYAAESYNGNTDCLRKHEEVLAASANYVRFVLKEYMP